ncbi:MAG: dTDP-glucose 4,6-dehydratase [Chloroflexi bacterium]|nr:dTDP-glucose 4,6-dehydratase [Chloroflexota bacterium]
MKHLLVTGGAGFIGSNFVRCIFGKYPQYQVVVLDKLTYAGNLENLKDVATNPRYTFVHGDICDAALVDKVMQEYGIDAIVNFAAETHVDRSLLEPASFLMTDVYGTYVLLEAARRFEIERFLQVSTDEVYGHIEQGSVKEDAPLSPRSPYSASKAGADMMVQAYYISHDVPTFITRGSNTFGPYHHPEKLIPLCITNALDDLPLPIYGDGRQVRDWLYVEDHCFGIDVVLHQGKVGEVYNLGGGNERYNLEVVQAILKLLSKPDALIRHVADRPGHDRRYSLDSTKLISLGWQRTQSFEKALAQTVQWYRNNEAWWRKIKGGEFSQYYQKQYGQRLANPGSGQIQ